MATSFICAEMQTIQGTHTTWCRFSTAVEMRSQKELKARLMQMNLRRSVLQRSQAEHKTIWERSQSFRARGRKAGVFPRPAGRHPGPSTTLKSSISEAGKATKALILLGKMIEKHNKVARTIKIITSLCQKKGSLLSRTRNLGNS